MSKGFYLKVMKSKIAWQKDQPLLKTVFKKITKRELLIKDCVPKNQRTAMDRLILKSISSFTHNASKFFFFFSVHNSNAPNTVTKGEHC